jgi:AcrR family transcriptional regulator
MQKGQQTKAAIVEAALGLATHIGLEGLSIGALADITGMSKSGVFAHFGSREELQISVIREYHARFEQEVFYPAMSSPRGIERLRALFDNWMKRTSVEIDSGCIYISGAVEFDDRTGPVRDALASSVMTWHAAMRRAIEQCRTAASCVPTPTKSRCCSRSMASSWRCTTKPAFCKTSARLTVRSGAFRTSWRATARPAPMPAPRLFP